METTGEWQPIETAPRSTPILVTDGEIIVVVEREWLLFGKEEWPEPVGFGGDEWEWSFEWADLTHWMPLPKLPSHGGK